MCFVQTHLLPMSNSKSKRYFSHFGISEIGKCLTSNSISTLTVGSAVFSVVMTFWAPVLVRWSLVPFQMETEPRLGAQLLEHHPLH